MKNSLQVKKEVKFRSYEKEEEIQFKLISFQLITSNIPATKESSHRQSLQFVILFAQAVDPLRPARHVFNFQRLQLLFPVNLIRHAFWRYR